MAREGIEFGVVDREMAVGGQQLVLQGLRGTYEDVYLPLFGAHQAGNAACSLAAVEAFAGVSDSGVVLDPGLVRDGFAKVSSPGRLEILRRSPTVLADAAHNPAGMAATLEALTETFGFARVIGVVAIYQDKDVAGFLEELEPVLSDVVVTANSSPRSMSAEELAVIAREVFGEDRVLVRDRIDDAIEAAVSLADEPVGDDLPGSTAVLITGSVATAGRRQAPARPRRTPSTRRRPRECRPGTRLRRGTSREAVVRHRPRHGGRDRSAGDRADEGARARAWRHRGRRRLRYRGPRDPDRGPDRPPAHGWALYAGSVLQVLVIVSGVLIPAMYILGVIFAALWFTGIWLARRVERRTPPPSPAA